MREKLLEVISVHVQEIKDYIDRQFAGAVEAAHLPRRFFEDASLFWREREPCYPGGSHNEL